MDRNRRRELTVAAEVNRAVSVITEQITTIAAETQWTAEQRLGFRLLAGRLSHRSFSQFQAETEKEQRRKAAENAIRQIAIRIATLTTAKGEKAELILDDHVVAAARVIISSARRD